MKRAGQIAAIDGHSVGKQLRQATAALCRLLLTVLEARARAVGGMPRA